MTVPLGTCEPFSRTLASMVSKDRTSHPSAAARILLGLEHEYRVLEGSEQVDFAHLAHDLPLGPRHLDPGDLNAYRLASGTVLTCDGREAELAFPPISARPGFTARLERAAVVGRRQLQRLLPMRLTLEGYSTHFSVSVDSELVEPVARRYLRTFAPAMMLLTDRRESPGLIVRPRPGRVELCVEFAEGSALRAGAAMAVGSVLACVAALRDRGRTPPEVRGRVAPAAARYGWYLDRRAFGGDLLAEGRDSILRNGRRSIRAQEHLETSWGLARSALTGIASDEDVGFAERMVAGSLALPLEAGLHESRESDRPIGLPASSYGRARRPVRRPGFAVAPVMVTWQVAVFAILDSETRRHAFATIPHPLLDSFVRRLSKGELDEAISGYLKAPPSGRILANAAQASEPGLYDEMGPRRSLLPPEREAWRPLRRRLQEAGTTFRLLLRSPTRLQTS